MLRAVSAVFDFFPAPLKDLASGLIASCTGSGDHRQGQPAAFETNAADFLTNRDLHEEVFGASGLVVPMPKKDDYETARAFIPLFERKAGRLILNGFGTGVDVGHAMVHGGPFPATLHSRTTSVGSLAINRFIRPLSYQTFPPALLPSALLDENPLDLPAGLIRRRKR